MINIQISKRLDGSDGPMSLDINQQIKPGQLITVYGNSGAGKTSLLRMLAGLMAPDSGSIQVNGEVWLDTDRHINIKAGKRSIGMVFQDYGLFPNMTVHENLVYGLRKGSNRKFVDEIMAVVELGNLESRHPESLSGGQRQRVALARALVGNPKILLLDEPLSALDREMRAKLQDYVLKLHREFNLTTLMVSHDVSEIFKLSDAVLHLVNGKVRNFTPPVQMFSHRHLSGKFQFIGEVTEIVAEDIIFVITVLIDNHLVRVIVDHSTADELAVGDKVMVASKAFNPVIRKI